MVNGQEALLFSLELLQGGGLNHLYVYAGSNAVNYFDPLGLWRIGVGVRGSFFFGGAGATAGASLGVDGSGQVCMQVQSCGRLGGGASITASGTASVGTGNYCEGNSLGGGVFGTIGLGPVASGSTNTTSSGTMATAALGAGGGGSGGVQACITRTFCKQVF